MTIPKTLVGYPDLIIHNAKIVAMDDPSFQPTTDRVVQAMAARQGRILALGSNQEILELAGPKRARLT